MYKKVNCEDSDDKSLKDAFELADELMQLYLSIQAIFPENKAQVLETSCMDLNDCDVIKTSFHPRHSSTSNSSRDSKNSFRNNNHGGYNKNNGNYNCYNNNNPNKKHQWQNNKKQFPIIIQGDDNLITVISTNNEAHCITKDMM